GPVMVPAGTQPPGPAWWQIVLMVTLLPLGIAAPFGTTILGNIAMSQIRRSGGRLHGLSLAVADALFYPLLVLDALIFFAFVRGMEFHPHPYEFRQHPQFVLLWLIASLLIVAVDYWIVRSVWRAASGPLPNRPQAPAAAQQQRRLPVAVWT